MALATLWRRSSIEFAAICILAAFFLLYGGDYLALRLRMMSGGAAAATSAVTTYYAAPLKDNKYSVYYDQPQSQTCVRAIFPWLGYEPCWYVKRHTVRLS